MQQLINRIRDKTGSYLLNRQEAASALGIHVDAVKALVEMELLPCIRINSRLGEWFREDDIRFLLLK